MFEDSLLESAGKLKRTNPLYAIFSFSLQVVLVGILILIPLIYTEALPKTALATFLVAPPPPPPPPPPAAAQIEHVVRIQSELDRGQLRTPTAIPKRIAILHEEDMAPPSSGVVGGVLGGVPGGQTGGVIGGVLGNLASTTNVHVAPPKRITVSQGVTQGMLINRVQPMYPPLAKQARVQGQVILQAVIGKDGAIQNLHVVSGHPMLVQSALDAVKQWRYRPYFLNGEPVEVDTQITVNFSLTGG